MNSVAFADIYNKPELILLIYKLLSFRDQLNLAATNAQLKSIFQSFIYPGDFRTLHTVKVSGNNFLVSNEGDANCLVMTSDELVSFVSVYADSVEVFSEDMSPLWCVDGIKSFSPDTRLKAFKNLISLKYVSLMIVDKDMHEVAINCPKLSELYLIHCHGDEDREAVQIGRHIQMSTIQKIRNLKKLAVEAQYHSLDIEFGVLSDLLSKVKLQSFSSKSYLVANAKSTGQQADVACSPPPPLRELRISTSFALAYWGKQQQLSSFLRLAENLSVLRIHMAGVVTKDVLQTIAETCVNLEIFAFEGNAEFRAIKEFAMPPKVTEFSLNNCYGLKYRNLKQLLTHFHIQKFSSSYVTYEGKFHDFAISPHIQVLQLDGVATHKFPSAYVNNANLKELTWHEREAEDDEEFNECPDAGALETCINLDSLNVHTGYVPLEPLLKLPNLRKLTVNQEMSGFSWHYIVSMLQHPSLREFNVCSWLDGSVSQDLLQSSDIPAEGFVTNVEKITIGRAIFKRALHFWLDLFARNLGLIFVCTSFENNPEFIRQLISHPNFPRDLRTIDVWGVRLHCNELRRNFHSAISQLYPIIQHLDSYCIYMDRIGRLIISREL